MAEVFTPARSAISPIVIMETLDLKLGSTVKVSGMNDATTVPNHHAHYHGCSGIPGWIAGASMLFGRGDDARLAARLAAIGPGDTLLDVGSGPGVAARLAAKKGAKVTGVDPSFEMRTIAKLTTLP